MIALLVGSFFFIGVFTYYNFKRQNQNYHENRLLRKEASTLSSIRYYIQSHPKEITSKYDIKSLFKNKIHEWEDVHSLDIAIYDLEGELILYSNEKLSIEEVISGTINQSILEELTNQKIRIKQRLNHQGLDYLNSYQYIFDLEGKPIAIISIPYFELDDNYKRDLQSYFIALSFLYFLLFVVASVLAFLLARQITDPMNKLSESMKKATLRKKYIPLNWDSSDEVGQLVQQYNYMGKELEKNAITLAKNEKENAWKEMAKQVAHEIKNPLTPMKLNVQLFERMIKLHAPEFKEKGARFTSSMVDQIDKLASIASAFSNFAKMPSSNKVQLNLTETLENILFLYQSVNIKLFQAKVPVYIIGDNEQIISVLNNLINNAIEASKENSIAEIVVRLGEEKNMAILSITDSGSGIPKEVQEKVFEPNFTTKNSGMGLGLAMAKQILTDLNGSIQFTSEENIGTTFNLSIPLLKQKTK